MADAGMAYLGFAPGAKSIALTPPASDRRRPRHGAHAVRLRLIAETPTPFPIAGWGKNVRPRRGGQHGFRLSTAETSCRRGYASWFPRSRDGQFLGAQGRSRLVDRGEHLGHRGPRARNRSGTRSRPASIHGPRSAPGGWVTTMATVGRRRRARADLGDRSASASGSGARSGRPSWRAAGCSGRGWAERLATQIGIRRCMGRGANSPAEYPSAIESLVEQPGRGPWGRVPRRTSASNSGSVTAEPDSEDQPAAAEPVQGHRFPGELRGRRRASGVTIGPRIKFSVLNATRRG